MENKQTLWTKDLILITIVNLFMFLSFQMIIATLPLHVEDIGGTERILGWITGLATISAVLIRPITGIALDKLSRKIVFITGLIILLVSTYFLGVFNYIWLILIIRFINGIGWGIGTTTAMTVAAETIPIKRFGEGIGLFNLSNGLGMAFGPLIGISILNAQSFSNVALPAGMLVLAALVFSLFIKYKPVDKTVKAHIRNGKLPSVEKSSLGPALIIGLITITYGAIIAFIPIYGIERGVENIGLYFTIYALFLMFIRPLAGKMMDKRGFDIFVYSGVITLSLSMIVLSQSQNIIIFAVSAALYGIGFGLLETSLLTMAVARAPEGKIGSVNAVFFTFFDGGIGFGSIIAGIIASVTSYGRMYLILIIPLIIAGILYKFIKSTN
ncbi:MAG: MFS transporter [Tissierellia bacterium]|nr:MFS transporter [Tissierellia bacterium]MDD4436908.1 MFS transporter [Tissierellia bacterium]